MASPPFATQVVKTSFQLIIITHVQKENENIWNTWIYKKLNIFTRQGQSRRRILPWKINKINFRGNRKQSRKIVSRWHVPTKSARSKDSGLIIFRVTCVSSVQHFFLILIRTRVPIAVASWKQFAPKESFGELFRGDKPRRQRRHMNF